MTDHNQNFKEQLRVQAEYDERSPRAEPTAEDMVARLREKIDKLSARQRPQDAFDKLSKVTLPDVLALDHFKDPAFGDENDLGPAITKARNVYRQISQNAQNLMKARSERDPTRSAAHQIQELQKGAKQLLDKHVKGIDDARQIAEVEIANVNSDIRQHCNLKETARAAEIRRHLASLKDSQRNKLVEQALESGDGETFGAITSAPAYLSGHTPEQVQALKRGFEHRHASHLLAKRDRIEKALDLLKRAARERYTLSERLVNPEAAEAAAKALEKSQRVSGWLAG